MKKNRFRQLIDEGGTPVGHMLMEFNTRGMAQILEVAGVDFAVMDMEHGSFTIVDVANMVSWFKATALAPFVRVSKLQYHRISCIMDAGVLGVVAANVEGAAEARSIVDAVKYPPEGGRGFYYGGASTDFRMGDAGEYIRESNENTTVICMIESPEGVNNVEEIAATRRVDGLWVGHWDLSQYMGIPGEFHDKRFLDAIARIIESAATNGLQTIIQPGSRDQLEDFVKLGFSIISYGGDFYLYRDALTAAVAEVRKVVGQGG